MRARCLLLLLSSLLVVSGCHRRVKVQAAESPDLEARADNEARNYAKGTERFGPALRGLAQETDGYVDFQVPMEAGVCYTFGYAGDPTVNKFSIYVWDPSDRRVETLRNRPPEGAVSHCAVAPGQYRVQGKVSEGAGHFVVVVYRPSRGGVAGTPPPAGSTSSVPVGSGLSDSEKKATARAAFTEGLSLQEKGDCVSALVKFQAAERLFDAPTHLLHIAQCQVDQKQLVEAQETYETLSHANLPAGSPEAFVQAQAQAKKELPALRSRVPTLKVQVAPAGTQGLIVVVNGKNLGSDLIGLARPVNPGNYKVSASAKGFKPWNGDVDVKEGEQKVADVKLTK